MGEKESPMALAVVVAAMSYEGAEVRGIARGVFIIGNQKCQGNKTFGRFGGNGDRWSFLREMR